MTGRASAPTPARQYCAEGHEVFAGYYDVNVNSEDGGAILAHKTRCARTALQGNESALVGFFDRDSGKFAAVSDTSLWCWQLGARLRWWPGEHRGLAFNRLTDGKASYCLYTGGKTLTQLCDCPLFDVSSNGQRGISLNFGRLALARPGYGFPGLEDPFVDTKLPEKDGVTIVDLISGRADLIFSLRDFANIADTDKSDDFHYLNAASLSPDGSRFSVLYKTVRNLAQPHSWRVEAFVGCTDGSDLKRVCLPGAASHYWWLDNETIAYTANSGGSSTYVLVSVADNQQIRPFPGETPDVDGHPSRHDPTGRWVTDEYPDIAGEQALHIIEPDGSRNLLGRFFADPRYRDEWKCDLHPRWSVDGKNVIVDSTHNGFRAIYEIEARRHE